MRMECWWRCNGDDDDDGDDGHGDDENDTAPMKMSMQIGLFLNYSKKSIPKYAFSVQEDWTLIAKD